MAEKVAKRGKDLTRTPRAKAHLERIAADRGKRIVVDFDGEHRTFLEELIDAGYEDNQSDVLRRAVREAHERNSRKS